MAEFILRSRGIVSIVEDRPFPGRCTIHYTPPEGFIAKTMEVPQRAFLTACRELADRMEARAQSAKPVETVTPIAPEPVAPKPPKSFAKAAVQA